MLLMLLSGCVAGEERPESSCECDLDTDSDADSDTDTDADSDSDTDPPSLKVGVPAYFYPGALWPQASTPGEGVLVANPASGPGESRNEDYVAAIDAARAAGMIVLGYIHTSYGERPREEVLAEVAAWSSFYTVDGVFFDEVPGMSTCAGHQALYEGYADVVAGVVAMNPGTETCQSYMAFADLLVVWEDSGSKWGTWSPPAWMADYDRERFWVLAHDVSTAEEMADILRGARQANVRYVYVTDDALPNPWDSLPAYWSEELSAL